MRLLKIFDQWFLTGFNLFRGNKGFLRSSGHIPFMHAFLEVMMLIDAKVWLVGQGVGQKVPKSIYYYLNGTYILY